MHVKKLTFILISLLLIVPCAAVQIIYVDANVAGPAHNGSSWETAYEHLQDALADANSNPDVNDIWVAQGTYTPDSNETTPDGTGEREATFQLINGVAIYGGFPTGGGDWSSRDPNINETIFSGDIGIPRSSGDNSYHVMIGSHTGEETIIDGLTISGGYADGPYPYGYRGGGLFIESGSPTLENCTFTNNYAFDGGGLHIISSSRPLLKNCTFVENSATSEGGGIFSSSHSSVTLLYCTFTANRSDRDGAGVSGGWGVEATVRNCTFTHNVAGHNGGGLYKKNHGRVVVTDCNFSRNEANCGGGMAISNYSDAIVTGSSFVENTAKQDGGGFYRNIGSTLSLSADCTFVRNVAGRFGGGVYNSGGTSTTMSRCTISENRASEDGGGLYNRGNSPTLTDCVISGNTANGKGGGVYSCVGSNPTLVNCILSDNSAEAGGGIYNHTDCTLTLSTCALISNTAEDHGGGIYCDGGNPVISNSTIVGNKARGNYGRGGGIYCYRGNSMVSNCILWNNRSLWGSQLALRKGDLLISYSDIEGGSVYVDEGTLNWLEGNIDSDPCFVEAGYWDANGTPSDANDDFWVDGDYHLLADSLCIDAGDPCYVADVNETDMDGNPRVIGGRIDIGAYEFLPGPVEVLDILVEGVIDLGLQQGIENGLLAKLYSAIQALEDDNDNNDAAAINSLGAFINAVEAQRGKKITGAEADILVGAAQEIIELLGDG